MDNRSTAVIDASRGFRREVPGLHPGLNDLIRVLGKQAHCSSRTLIVCEPVCPRPSYSESKYHKNCGTPKKGRSWDSLCRPSSLWSPVRPDTYYYDCFFYRQYPDRDSEYQEIEDKYNAIKQEKLDYSPPECDEDKTKPLGSGGSQNKGGRGRGGVVPADWSGSGAFRKKVIQTESTMGSQRGQKYPLAPGSKQNVVSEGGSVPCAELAEIRDLLKQSDRETIIRMQEMLALMKELSVRDICRATCDGGRFKAQRTKDPRSDEDFYEYEDSKAPQEQGTDFRKRKAEDDSDYGPQDKKKRYEPRGDPTGQSGELDGYGPQGSNRSYQQRSGDYEAESSMKSYKQQDDEYGTQGSTKSYKQKDDDYESEGSKKGNQGTDDDPDLGLQGSRKSYQQRDGDDYYGSESSKKSYQQKEDGQGPRESQKPYRLSSDSSRRRKGKFGDDDDDGGKYGVERQESETSYKQGESAKNRKGDADEDTSLRQASIRSSQQREPEKRKKPFSDDDAPAEDGGENGEEYVKVTHDLDNDTPLTLTRHPSMSRETADGGSESLSSASESEKSDQALSRGKGQTRNDVSESDDTDMTDKSSMYSKPSKTDGSSRGKGVESDFDISDVEFEEPGKASSSRSTMKRNQDDYLSSSQASLSVQGSAHNLGKTGSDDRSRPGLNQGQISSKQSTVPSSAPSRAPDQPGPGANYKIPVGKKNVPLTVHEVLELSNKITDAIVIEIIDELMKNSLYRPPSKRNAKPQEPYATMPRTSVESQIKSISSRQRLNEQTELDETKESSGNKEERMKSPSRLSRIDESSSRTTEESNKKDGSTQEMKQGEKRRSGESRRSSCPRHNKSLSPSTSSQRRSPSCRLEIERRAKSEGDSAQPQGSTGPPKPWERRLSSQMKLDSMRDSSTADTGGRPGSHGPSMSSQKRKTGSDKAPSTQTDQVSLRDSPKDGSLSKRQPTLPGSKQKITDCRLTSTTQSEAPAHKDMPGNQRPSKSSQRSKSTSSKAPVTQPDQAPLKDGIPPRQSIPGSCRASMESQMTKKPDKNRSSGTDGRQRDTLKDDSGSGTQIEAPYPVEKVPSGLRTPKKSSWPQGIAKNITETPQMQTQIEDGVGQYQEPIVSSIPKGSTHEDVHGTGSEPSGFVLRAPQTPVTRSQTDTTSRGPRVIGQDTAQPTLAGEGEGSKGELVTIHPKEKIHQPESSKSVRESSQPSEPCQPCKPDDFIATDYDTDDSILYYARLTSKAFPPVKETYHAAGFMLRSAYDYNIPPRSKMTIKTDLLVQLPRKSYGRIAPRKCLVENYGIDVGADVIDRDYRGNLTVVLFNHSDKPFTVERGNKVAQLICESIHLAKVIENNELLH